MEAVWATRSHRRSIQQGSSMVTLSLDRRPSPRWVDMPPAILLGSAVRFSAASTSALVALRLPPILPSVKAGLAVLWKSCSTLSMYWTRKVPSCLPVRAFKVSQAEE